MMADMYKASHAPQLPKDTTLITSFFEARVGSNAVAMSRVPAVWSRRWRRGSCGDARRQGCHARQWLDARGFESTDGTLRRLVDGSRLLVHECHLGGRALSLEFVVAGPIFHWR